MKAEIVNTQEEALHGEAQLLVCSLAFNVLLWTKALVVHKLPGYPLNQSIQLLGQCSRMSGEGWVRSTRLSRLDIIILMWQKYSSKSTSNGKHFSILH